MRQSADLYRNLIIDGALDLTLQRKGLGRRHEPRGDRAGNWPPANREGADDLSKLSQLGAVFATPA